MSNGILPILGVIFITLKLCGVIAWSWWWVLAPFWAWLIIVVIAALVVSIVFKKKKTSMLTRWMR